MHISSHPVPQLDQAKQALGRMGAAGLAEIGKAIPSAPSKAPVDVITLSDEAKTAIAEINNVRGKSAESPAHVAREQFMAAKIASGAASTDVRFGEVVSRIARGISTDSLFGAGPATEGEGSGDVTAVTVVDGKTAVAPKTNQDETIIPTEDNTAAVQISAPIAGDTIKVAVPAKAIGEVDVLDLLSADKGDILELIA
jgi:hypothetical protein